MRLPGDRCDARCLNPDPQPNEALDVRLIRDDGEIGWRGEAPDLNGGGGDDYRATAQQCRQRDHDFGEIRPEPGRWRVTVQHVDDEGPNASVKLQTSRVHIACE